MIGVRGVEINELSLDRPDAALTYEVHHEGGKVDTVTATDARPERRSRKQVSPDLRV